MTGILGKGMMAVLGSPLTWVAAATALGYAIGQLPIVKEFLSGKEGVFTNLFGGGDKGGSTNDAVLRKTAEGQKLQKSMDLTNYYVSRGIDVHEATARARKELGMSTSDTYLSTSAKPAYDVIGEDGTVPGRGPVATVRTDDMPDPSVESSKQTAAAMKEYNESVKKLIEVTQEGQNKTIASIGTSRKTRDPYSTGDPLMERMMVGDTGTEEY
jgi:hypothetical protein